jgi:hypothetical protein
MMSAKVRSIAQSSEATAYSVEITMSNETVEQLLNNGFQLYGFKGVDGPPNGVPVVWFSTNVFSMNTNISWTEQYAAYTSLQTNLGPGTQIVASSSSEISLGQLDTINIGGIGTVTNDGSVGEIAVLNATTTPYTCGLSVMNLTTGSANPICAFPLFGGGLDNFAPIEVVYFMFATNPINTGVVVEQAFAPGIQVDMSGGITTATLEFDINMGWRGPGYTTSYPANQNLVPVLVNPGGVKSVSQRQARRFVAHKAA